MLLLFSCEKKPNASFKTDKMVYVAGDTVRLTNTSSSGSSFIWTMPDGHTETGKNAKFQIDPDHWFDQLTISLSSKSKGHCKRDYTNSSIKVIPQSWYIEANAQTGIGRKYLSSILKCYSLNSNFIFEADASWGTWPNKDSYWLYIYFPQDNYPPAGTYILQSSKNNLQPYTAFVNLYGGAPDMPGSINYVTGQIQVEYIEGTMHVYFTDIYTSPVYYKLSGNLFYYM